jgi:hypothetical protein
MKPISELAFGFADAENSRRRENKDLFNRISLRTSELDKLCERNVFFLIGERYRQNSLCRLYVQYLLQIFAHHKFIRETDYQQFVSLNQTKNLTLSNYTDIWTILLLLLLSAGIYITVSKTPFLLGYPKFRALRDAIDEYYNHAFSPEIITALRFIENADLAAELVAKYAGAGVTLRQARTSKKAPRKSVFRRTCYFFKRVLKRLSLL